MNKEFFDKHSKDLGCSDCSNLQYCIEREDPSYVSCAMTYYKEQVANLEAKLAEMQNEKDELSSKYRYWKGECAELKERLAEKEKETETLQHYNGRLAQGIYHSYGEHFILKVKQDKISFAVEQLEKVKEEIGNNISSIIFQDSRWLGKQTVLDKIDNQVKQLKKMK